MLENGGEGREDSIQGSGPWWGWWGCEGCGVDGREGGTRKHRAATTKLRQATGVSRQK